MADNEKTIDIIEMFLSLNGEGHGSGFPCVFIRTMGCNLRCQYGSILNDDPTSMLNGFCDTPESLSPKHFKEMYPLGEPLKLTVDEIFNKTEEIEKDWKYKSICLTGGEPLLPHRQNEMMKLIEKFLKADYDVSVETNGSIDYTPYKKAFGKAKICEDGRRRGFTLIADYKLPSSGMTKKMLKENFEVYDETDIVKLVISDLEEDWDALEEIIEIPTKASFYLSPMYNRCPTERLWKFVEGHADKNIRAQLQIHKYFFEDPNKKGV